MVSSIMRSTLQGKISPALLTEQRAVFCNYDGPVADEVDDKLKGSRPLRNSPALGVGRRAGEYLVHLADLARRVAHGADPILAWTVIALRPAPHEATFLVEEPLHAYLAPVKKDVGRIERRRCFERGIVRGRP